jgi:hypothetical protein
MVKIAEGGIQTFSGPVPIAVIKIILPDGKTVKFNSIRYKSNEFVKKVKLEMFLNLFQIYFELGNN